MLSMLKVLTLCMALSMWILAFAISSEPVYSVAFRKL